jgi:AcrR family transcriptional regulator
LTVKQQLLEAAIVVVDEHGEAALRIRDLLETVGVTAPTLYHHFGTRQDLIDEVQAERFNRTMRMDFPVFIEAVKASKSQDDLREAIRFVFTLRDDPSRLLIRFQRLNALGSAYARPDLARRIMEVHEYWAREVAAALRPFQESGLIRRDVDLEMLVAWYNGAAVGKMLVEIGPSTLDVAQWNVIMSDALEHLLFGK